jgi:V/A-type H+-transporting ATPase subunit E
MPKNIEAFVETLKSEGVDAGKKAAEKIEADAQTQADQIIAKAKAKADQMIAKADIEAGKIKSRMDSSLELATRDALLALKEKLSQLLNSLLAKEVETALSKEDTLASVLREVIPAYAKGDAEASVSADIVVPKALKGKLLDSTLKELVKTLKNQGIQADVKSSLAQAGFEYKIEGSTVEVSTDSVTALLTELIDPELRHILDSAIANKA